MADNASDVRRREIVASIRESMGQEVAVEADAILSREAKVKWTTLALISEAERRVFERKFGSQNELADQRMTSQIEVKLPRKR